MQSAFRGRSEYHFEQKGTLSAGILALLLLLFYVKFLPDVRVLMVDDNKLNRMIVVEMLQQKKYDLVFMDYQMPVMDGVEAVKAIRALEGEYY